MFPACLDQLYIWCKYMILIACSFVKIFCWSKHAGNGIQSHFEQNIYQKQRFCSVFVNFGLLWHHLWRHNTMERINWLFFVEYRYFTTKYAFTEYFWRFSIFWAKKWSYRLYSFRNRYYWLYFHQYEYKHNVCKKIDIVYT